MLEREREREFQPGDQVLFLLVRPFKVAIQSAEAIQSAQSSGEGETTWYDLHSHWKSEHIFHVNMLRKC